MRLEEQLWEEARRVDFSALPFLRSVADGSCPIEVLRAYALDLATLAEGFTGHLATIFAHCDDVPVRHAVLANLLEEEGVQSFDGHELVTPAGRGHGALACELARVFGADPAAPRRPLRSTWLDQKLRAGDWLSALAFMTVGYEANVPTVFKPLVEGLRTHYGYSDADLEYLVMHVTADEEHGAEGVAMVGRLGVTPETRQLVLDGARRGTLAWYQVHRRHGQAIERRSVA
ncbi:MAG TPA: iron-containing redox enzyme family protein [Vicinamibacterales bacterium]|nr:iron-containing redox enzyme family protein [Vicinamibacterales bacterium]